MKAILPALLPSVGWEKFPELYHFERWRYPPSKAQGAGFDKLAASIPTAGIVAAGIVAAGHWVSKRGNLMFGHTFGSP